MGEQVFDTFTLGLYNTSWVIVAEIWLYNILCHELWSKLRNVWWLKVFQDCTKIPLDKSRTQPITISFMNKMETNSPITNSIPSILLNLKEISSYFRFGQSFKKRKKPKKINYFYSIK